VLRLLASGQNRKQIAGHLVVSDSTVRSHLEHIYGKVDVSTRVGAVLFAIENGLVV
jgi:DNA-binding NarL/FixJ family response regulator